MKRILVLIFCVVLYSFVFSPGCTDRNSNEVNLSPAKWPEGDFEKYAKLNNVHSQPHPLAVGTNGMVAATQEALAVRAGLEALKQGGSAADAAMTTALSQIALAAGCWVSYAGFMNMVYYEAKSGKIYSMNAAYNTVLEEDDPLSIPFQDPFEKPRPETPSGRSALIPGFMAGVQAAHDRFGKLPFFSLFEPAIYFAENGFRVSSKLAGYIDFRKDVLTRLPETHQVFMKENGELYGEGDLFKQPKLAYTLRNVAAHGAGHMFKGEWAKRCVEAVRQEGGKITLKDLENYEVMWQEPLHSKYRNYDIYTLNFPNYGGAFIIEALNLLELADIPQFGHYTTSPEALYRFIQITRIPRLIGIIQKRYPEIDFSSQSRIKKETAKFIWEKMQGPDWKIMWQELYGPIRDSSSIPQGSDSAKRKLSHSEGVVVVDQWGNVAAVLHTINTVFWGMTGIFVDGVSIPDSACFQQQVIKQVGPGARLPEGTNPLLIFKDGRPFLASSCIGSGLYEETLQKLINILDFGMDPKTSADTVSFLMPGRMPTDAHQQIFAEGEFSTEIFNKLRRMGQDIKVVPQEDRMPFQGCWTGITLDPKTEKLKGGVPRQKNGLALGY